MFRARISQTKLAPQVGISQSVLSKKLRGSVPWSVTELIRVSVALGVRPADLLPDDLPANLLPEAEMVRRQGLEPRTRWFGAGFDETDSLAIVLPFDPNRARRLTTLRPTLPHRPFRRDADRLFSPILLHCGVSS